MSEGMTTAARGAIEIADRHLPRTSIERRKELALEIVQLIGRCEAELAAAIVRRLSN